MNFSLRSSAAAAAILLAPLGAALVAQPVAAQPARVAAAPNVAPAVIERVTAIVDAQGRNQDVQFRLVGTPGARAYVRAPGLFDTMALQETRPGVYEAIRTLRPSDDLRGLNRAVGILENGMQRVTAQATIERDRDERQRGERRDHRPPQIGEVTPAQGDRVSERGLTRISARVSDFQSGVHSITLRVDGRDVSRRVRIDGDDIRYADNLRPGRHTAELQVRDRAGNVAQRSWTFFVVDHDRRG